MAYKPPTTSNLVAALIVGGSVLAGSILLNVSLRDTSEKLEGIQVSLTETRQELKTIASRQPAAKSNRSGPDPNRRYAINTKGSPYKGPMKAQVEIVEFSDFQ